MIIGEKRMENKSKITGIAAKARSGKDTIGEIIQYLTNYRLEKSIEYLHHSSHSITDIALLCGFNSSSYFTEVFRRELRCTPSEYKVKIKNSFING